MIVIIRTSTAPQNAANPPVNASVSTWAAPKVVLRLFFGAPASVRPICLSIIINFLSLLLSFPSCFESDIKQRSCQEVGRLALFIELPRRVLLGNWASGVPIPGNKGMKLRLSEVAEFARLEPLQYLLEGLRPNAGSAGEGMVHGNDCE